MTACDGGGRSDPVIDFSYPTSTAYLWRETVLAIQVAGLENTTPTCRISAGDLPAGLSLESVGCAIVGTPTQTGTFPITVQLSAAGIAVQVEKPVSIFSVGPSIVYPELTEIRAGTPVSFEPSPAAGNPLGTPAWAPVPGESVTYSLGSGTLPTGISLNALTGTLSGLPTEPTSGTFVVEVDARSANRSYAASARPHRFLVNPGLELVYDPNEFPMPIVAYWNQPFSLPAQARRYPPGFDQSEYRFANFRRSPGSGSLPTGIQLDPQTGLLSGVPQAPGSWTLLIEADVTARGLTGTIKAPRFYIEVRPF